MSRVVYFDCPSGASGDMILGALVDAGVALDALREQLASLPLPGWAIAAREVRRGAFRATKIDVDLEHEHTHHDDHHDHHPHDHHPPPQRTLGDVLAILRGGRLAAPALDAAERIFT